MRKAPSLSPCSAAAVGGSVPAWASLSGEQSTLSLENFKLSVYRSSSVLSLCYECTGRGFLFSVWPSMNPFNIRVFNFNFLFVESLILGEILPTSLSGISFSTESFSLHL